MHFIFNAYLEEFNPIESNVCEATPSQAKKNDHEKHKRKPELLTSKEPVNIGQWCSLLAIVVFHCLGQSRKLSYRIVAGSS